VWLVCFLDLGALEVRLIIEIGVFKDAVYVQKFARRFFLFWLEKSILSEVILSTISGVFRGV